ncbi:hypothetical protein [Streptomyces sp. NBC_01092]|uniref:VMAP-C domain-containing protein n=1 Tax=Streptomyces sp. NBC_01092 TaxID=2903748 RepID=UPI003870651A|nr:hypothetical protein OG254_20255 [Streptomyces sp. NBC_01092]
MSFRRRWLAGALRAGRVKHLRHGRYWKADRQLEAILLSTDGLHELAVRQELLLLTGERMGLDSPLLVRESPDPATHLRAIVRTARRAEALGALLAALSVVRQNDIGTAWFRLAVTVLTRPDGPLPGACVLSIVGELRAHPPEFGRTAVIHYMNERRAGGRSLDCRSVLPDVLFQLYDAREPIADPDAPRRDLLGFLRLLAAEQDRSSRLEALVVSVLDARPTDQLAPVVAGARASGERQVIIQIRVEEEDAPSDLPYTQRRYSLRGFHYEGIAGARPDFHCSWPAPGLFNGDELMLRGHEFLAAWRAREQVDWDANKRVEFLLPDSLLGYPAELWSSGAGDKPLSRRCQVVVRSLRRYKDGFPHDEWLRRWEALDRDGVSGDPLERIGWMSPDAAGGETCGDSHSASEGRRCPDSKYQSLRLTDRADVEDWLRHNADLACLGLGKPYDHHDPLIRDAVLDALLEDGIPVMVWRRDAGDPAHLLDELRNAKPPALLAELPDSVLEVRKRKRHDPASVGKQITLLWDDPTCVFRKQDSPMSGTRGAGEGAA